MWFEKPGLMSGGKNGDATRESPGVPACDDAFEMLLSWLAIVRMGNVRDWDSHPLQLVHFIVLCVEMMRTSVPARATAVARGKTLLLLLTNKLIVPIARLGRRCECRVVIVVVARPLLENRIVGLAVVVLVLHVLLLMLLLLLRLWRVLRLGRLRVVRGLGLLQLLVLVVLLLLGLLVLLEAVLIVWIRRKVALVHLRRLDAIEHGLLVAIAGTSNERAAGCGIKRNRVLALDVIACREAVGPWVTHHGMIGVWLLGGVAHLEIL